MGLLIKTFKTFVALTTLGFLFIILISSVLLVFYFCIAVFTQVSIFWGFMSVIMVLFLVALAVNALSGKTNYIDKYIDFLTGWL